MTDETEQESSEGKETNLAEEALNATAPADEETSPASESEQQGVPVDKHIKLRERAQVAEVARARAEGELTAMKEQQARSAPAAKSPLDLEVERQAAEGVPEEDMTISPAIIKANDLYNQQVANQATAAKAKEELGIKQTASANKAKAEIPDWQEVVLAGDSLLTQGELVDIAAAGADFGQVAYDKCKAAIERNRPSSESKANAAPEKEQSESEAETVPTQSAILKDLDVDPATQAAAQL